MGHFRLRFLEIPLSPSLVSFFRPFPYFFSPGDVRIEASSTRQAAFLKFPVNCPQTWFDDADFSNVNVSSIRSKLVFTARRPPFLFQTFLEKQFSPPSPPRKRETTMTCMFFFLFAPFVDKSVRTETGLFLRSSFETIASPDPMLTSGRF